MTQKPSLIVFNLSLVLMLLLPVAGYSGLIFQDFEPDNGSGVYGEAHNASVMTATAYEAQRFSGTQTWKIQTSHHWAGSTIFSQSGLNYIDARPEIHDRLSFWIRAIPDAGWWVFGPKVTHNTVGVTFYDTDQYQNGFEVWTTENALYNRWTKLTVLFSQLPEDFDLSRFTRIAVKNYWPGTYYIDDVQIVAEDRVYQSFENPFLEEYGWKWNSNDTAGLSADDEPVYEGGRSWKLVSTAHWGGTGIKSQEQGFHLNNGSPEQTFWHVDLNPEQNEHLTFQVYALPVNRMDNNLGVQLYDNDQHNTDATKVEVWLKKAAHTENWTKFSIPFSQLPATLNLKDVNKIQFQHYWPGTFYLDDIRSAKFPPAIHARALPDGIISWDPVEGADVYTLQESVSGPQGPWSMVYQGPEAQYLTPRLWPAWYRVRWEEAVSQDNPVAYSSDFSEPYAYTPKPVLIDHAALQYGQVTFNPIPQAPYYQVQRRRHGSSRWQDMYMGPELPFPLDGSLDHWYRVRGIRLEKDVIVESTDWSPEQTYDFNRGYIQARGTYLFQISRRRLEKIVLKGVNLGNVLLIEPEFSGIGAGDAADPFDGDEYTIRRHLISRFGTDDILAEFRAAYLDASDFDRMMRMGVNFVRLPIYHEAVQDEDGQYSRFDEIDRIINLCGQRGIYVLLDLHGAPGAQSKESHSGRKEYNRLFENSAAGQGYRDQMVRFWQAMARHYRDNVFVLGYDILNEPFGAIDHDPSLTAPHGLWRLYDRVYKAIRRIDPEHLIVMGSIPTEFDWDTLPDPKTYRWKNVMYQFHYYGFRFDENGNIIGVLDPEEHQVYINDKIANSRQGRYRVPVLIGEFSGFNQRDNWEQYFQAFNRRGWSWAVWTYKTFNSPSDWGLFNHAGYDAEPVNVASDSLEDLRAKFQRYTTDMYHVPNKTLISILQREFERGPANSVPVIREVVPAAVNVDAPFTIKGGNFGEAKKNSRVLLNATPVDILLWSNTYIVARLSAVEWPDTGTMTVETENGKSAAVAVSILQPPVISRVESVENPGQMRIVGRHFRAQPGRVWFFPQHCVSLDFDACPQGDAAVIEWTDTEILCQIPGQALANGSVFVITDYGHDVNPWW